MPFFFLGLLLLFGALTQNENSKPKVESQRPISFKNHNKLKIMVMDTGIDSSIPELRKYIPAQYWNDEKYLDIHEHGTHVAGIIAAKACEGVELIPCRVYNYKNSDNGVEFDENKEYSCLTEALDKNIDLVNFSSSGVWQSEKELKLLTQLNVKNIQVIVAAGNDNKNLDEYPEYPFSYSLRNVIGVGALNVVGSKLTTSNYGTGLYWELGQDVVSYVTGGRKIPKSGSSMAAAMYSSKIVEKFCKSLTKP